MFGKIISLGIFYFWVWKVMKLNFVSYQFEMLSTWKSYIYWIFRLKKMKNLEYYRFNNKWNEKDKDETFFYSKTNKNEQFD